MRLNAQLNACYAPLAATLASLKPFLHSIMHHAESDQLIQGKPSASVMRKLEASHLTALSSAKSLQALCIQASHLSSANCGTFASMKYLTKLHLSCESRHVTYQPLGHLSMLEDLTLQCGSPSATCPEVLLSSKHSLQRVQLTSLVWELETYQALQSLSSITLLVLRVQSLSTPSAAVVSHLSKPEIRLSIHDCNEMRPQAFRSLSTGMANIRELMLWRLDDTRCEQLQSMSNLEQLTIAQSGLLQFTGRTLKSQAGLKSLTLISCNRVQATGLARMAAAFPAMQRIAFLADTMMGLLQFDLLYALGRTSNLGHAIAKLSRCQNLEYIDLRGLDGMTVSDIDGLQAAFLSQQRLHQAPAKVTVFWSTHTRHWPQATVEISSHLWCLPKLYMLHAHPVGNDNFHGVKIFEPGLIPACKRCLIKVMPNPAWAALWAILCSPAREASLCHKPHRLW